MQFLLYYFLFFAVGVSIGSFLNAWVWRTRENLSIYKARSICTSCRVQIKWFDNIPVVSYIILMGKCRKCDNIISPHYPIIELVVGLVFVFVANFHSLGSATPVLSAELFRDLVILIFLTFVFLYDYKYREILNFTTILPGIVLFFLALFLGWKSWDSMLLGVAFGAGFFLFLYFISKGRWIGGGDVRLGFFMGVILGWPCVLVAFFIAYVLGAVVSLLLIAFKKKTMKSETAFGTYLVVGTAIAMFWCSHILEWYLSFIV